MSLRRIVVSVFIVAILSAGGYWAYRQYLQPREEEPDNPTAEVNNVAIDTGVDVVSAEGQILPLRHASLAFQVGGRVAEILVEKGVTVRAGERLIRLEDSDVAIRVRQAEAGLAGAEANLAAANAGLLAAQEAVHAAEIGVSAATIGVSVAEIGVTAAQAQAALIQADPLPEQIASFETSIDAAEAGINQAEANRNATLEVRTSQIRAAEARLAAAVAEERGLQEQYDTITRNDIGGYPEEQARLALNAAIANRNAAQSALDELNAGATTAQRGAANAAVTVALAQRDSAQSQLDQLLAGVIPERVTVAQVGEEQAQAAVTQAEAAVTQAQANVTQAEVAVLRAESAVAQAEAGVLQAKAVLDQANYAVEKTVLTAAFDGTIVDLSVELGEVVSPGMPLIELADISGWLVETTDLTEQDVVAVAIDFPVEVRADAIPDQPLKGNVAEIAAVSSLTRGDVTYAVTIHLEDVEDLPMRWGMTVFVDIEVP
jgi:multidrug resistance efflux pump